VTTRFAAGLALASLAVTTAPAAHAQTLAPTALSALSGSDLRCPVPVGSSAAGEAEPSLAVHPKHKRTLLAAWQQNRFRDGGAAAVGVSRSRDGGKTWRSVKVPGVTGCPPRSVDRASDPWVSVGPEGTAYLASLPLSESTPGPGVRIATSPDAGRTWRPPLEIDGGGFADKESVTADPFRPGVAYVAWTRVDKALGLFARTSDAGATWSAPVAIQRSAPGLVPTGHVLAPLRDGTLVDTYFDGDLTEGSDTRATIKTTVSVDGGATWSDPLAIGDGLQASVTDPDTKKPVRTGAPLPSIAATPDGTIAVVWPDVLGPRSSRIFMSRSADGGRTWSAPRAVVKELGQAFTPVITAAGDGSFALAYYDFRYDRRGDRTLTTDAWLARTQDGGRTWGTSHVAGPFDTRTAAVTQGGRFLGDYTGLVNLGRGAFAQALVQGRPFARGRGGDVFAVVSRSGASAPKIRLSAKAAPDRRRSRARVAFLARVGIGRLTRPLLGARVTMAGRSAVTDVHGRAAIHLRLKARRYTARATRPGFRKAAASFRPHR
jgi:hypothetical protein